MGSGTHRLKELDSAPYERPLSDVSGVESGVCGGAGGGGGASGVGSAPLGA